MHPHSHAQIQLYKECLCCASAHSIEELLALGVMAVYYMYLPFCVYVYILYEVIVDFHCLHKSIFHTYERKEGILHPLP